MRSALFLFPALFVMALSVLADPIVSDDMEAMCSLKGSVATFVYLNRDKVSEKDMLTILARDWKTERRDSWPYAAYVDMERIVRDGHRRQGGKYRRPCCTPEIAAARGIEALDFG